MQSNVIPIQPRLFVTIYVYNTARRAICIMDPRHTRYLDDNAYTVNQSTTHVCVFECAVAAVIQISNPAVHQVDRVVHRAPGDEARQHEEGQVRGYLLDHVPHVFLVDTLASSLGQLTIARRLRDHELCKPLC